jgi:hypothetical protein
VVRAYLSEELTNDAQKKAMEQTIADMKNRLDKFYKDENPDGDYSSLVQEVWIRVGIRWITFSTPMNCVSAVMPIVRPNRPV